ncbi:signal peptidase IB [Kordia sp. SMS9]|uniref:signal peptidase I n=1 Tax=Kordia sp. SMS9 TaxID=2282170 RepID=UPI000E1078C4|nr:signal peptidase I [Kordia sp. SMS9]AXG68019.1 signal peptidase IB [Kordia sp. SMS9]
MNKKLKIAIYILVGLIVVYQLLNFTKILAFYTVPTTGNEPNIKHGSFIIASNLITPKRGDFITYEFQDPMYGKSTMTHRLCAMENDTLEIRNGTLFINGKNVDATYNLKHAYILSEEKFNSLDETVTGKDYMIIPNEGKQGYLTYIEDKDAEKLQLKAYRFLDDKTNSDPKIKEIYQNDWNKNHFGPLIIPEGKIFVLGDNRDYSQDSRSYGLIDQEAITGVLWKTLFVIESN